MLQQAPANELQSIECVDQRLANRSIALERSDVEFTAGNREFEWFALLIRKSNNDLRREAMDLVARYPIRAGLRRERLNFRRNQSIHSLVVSFISRKTRNTSLSIYFCGVCVKEHIACSTVEDDIASLLEARWRMSIYRETRGAQHPLTLSKRGEI